VKEVRVVLIDEAILKYQSLKERASDSKKEMTIRESIKNKNDATKYDG